jgi:nucleobase:cation symporter-1, NCS1 family
MTLGAVVGIVVTSAGSDVLGDLYWQPYDLLAAIQAHYSNSPKGKLVYSDKS